MRKQVMSLLRHTAKGGIWTVALALALAMASCGGEKPTEPDPLGESLAAEAERINALAETMSFVMEHSRPDAAQSKALAETLERIVRNESGGAQPAPPANVFVEGDLGDLNELELEEDVFEFAERYKGEYAIAHEQLKDINQKELWNRSYKEGELGSEMWIAPASDGPLGGHEIQALRTLPALLFYDKGRLLHRTYAIVSVEAAAKSEAVFYKSYKLQCVMYEGGVLAADRVDFVSVRIDLDDYITLSAWNPFFGYNVAYWRKHKRE